jgi:hypothetical protein
LLGVVAGVVVVLLLLLGVVEFADGVLAGVVADVAEAVAEAARLSVSLRIPITCSSSLNCASCETNCVLSAGLSGSWFFICATNRFRNIDSLGVLSALAELEAELAAALAAEEPVTGLTDDAMTFSWRCWCGLHTEV